MNTHAIKVLLVDDDVELVDLLGYALRREGYNVVSAYDGEEAMQTWDAERPDLVLLDRRLPRGDGFDVCRQIRQRADTPIILLAERSAEKDIIDGLEAGADDFVPKPFSSRQLMARIQAVLRRYKPDPERLDSRQLCVGDLVLDPETQQVTRGGESIKLTRLEFRLLYRLAVSVGQIVPYACLVEVAWGYNSTQGSTLLLKAHITHLRRKLGVPRYGPGRIRTKLGTGYGLTKT